MVVRQISWSRALGISALIHCLLLSALGLFAGNLLANASQPPRLIEVELMSELAGSGGKGGGGQPPAGQPETASEPQLQPVRAIQPIVRSQPEEIKPEIADKPVEDKDVPAMATAHGPGTVASIGGGGAGLQTGNSHKTGAGGGSGTDEISGAGGGTGTGQLLPPSILKKYTPNIPGRPGSRELRVLSA